MGMRYYSWRCVGAVANTWVNHVFPSDFSHPALFTSLCGTKFNALNAESVNVPRCQRCDQLASAAEAMARVHAREQESKEKSERKELIPQIVAELEKRPLNELRGMLDAMRRRATRNGAE